MALKTLVKVGSITNLSDARYCAGMGVDMLGYRVIENQKDYVSAQTFQEMRGWITGPQIVAEIYGIEKPEQLSKIIEAYRPDFLELGLPEFHLIGGTITLPFILSISGGEDLSGDIIKPAYVLTQPRAPHFEKIIPGHDVLLTVSSLEELDQALKQTGISGVSLSGGHEIRPGLKNYDELAEILEALEVE